MIRIGEQPQRRARREAFDHGLQQLDLREFVARALQEQHRHVDLGQVRGTFVGGFLRRMQRETKGHQPVHARERRLRLRLRGHAPTEGFSAGEQRQLRPSSRGFRDCRAHRRVR